MSEIYDNSSLLYIVNIASLSIKNGIFNILFELNKNIVHNRYLSSFIFIVEFFQMLHFFFPLDRIGTLAESFGWSNSWIDWLSYVSGAFQVTPFLIQNPVNRTILTSMGAFSIVFISIYIILAFVVYWMVAEKKKYIFLIESLRYYSIILFNILFIPLLNALFLQTVCYDGTNGGMGCWQSNHLIFSVISVIFGSLLIVFAILYELTVFSRDPTSDSCLSGPHTRPQTILVILKALYCITFSIFYDSKYLHWILVVEMIVGNCFVAFLFAYLLPYYNWFFNHLRSSSLFVLAWTSIALLANFVYPSSATTFFFFLCLPIMIISSYAVLEYRRLYFMHCNVAECCNPYDIELKTRFLIQPITDYMIEKKVDYGHYMMKDDHVVSGYLYEALPSAINETNDLQLLAKKSHEKILEEVDSIYMHGLRRFPVPLMILFRAFLCSCYNSNPALAQHAITRADDLNPYFDESFSIQVIRTLYNETTDSNQQDIISFIAWQQNQDIARREDENATRHQLAFWEELLSPSPDLNRLQEVSSKISLAVSIAQDAFTKLIKLNSSSTHVLRLYSSFLLDIQNQPEKAAMMLKKADELEEAQSRMHKDSTEFSLLDDRSAVISISGEKDHLGDILNVNYGVVSLFGYSLHELLSGNITRLMIPPYTIHHTYFLQRYFETGVSGILNNRRVLFGLHKSGFIIPIDVFEIANSTVLEGITSNLSSTNSNDESLQNSSTFVGIIKLTDLSNVNAESLQFGIKHDGDEDFSHSKQKKSIADEIDETCQTVPEFAALDIHFNVATCTNGFASLFNLDIYEIRAGNVKISNLLVAFTEKFESGLQDRSGCSVTVSTSSHGDIEMHASISKITVKTDYYWLVQLSLPLSFTAAQRSVVKASKNVNEGDLNKFIISPNLEKETYNKTETNEFDSKVDSEEDSRNEFSEDETSVYSAPSVSIEKRNSKSIFSPDMNKNAKRCDEEVSRSTGSAGSRASTNSLANLHNRIQAFSKANEQQTLGAGLRKLQTALLFSMILLTLTSILKFVLVTSFLNSIISETHDVINIGICSTIIGKITYFIQILTHCPTSRFSFDGFYNEAECTRVTSDYIIPDIVRMEELVDDFFVRSRSTFSSELTTYSFTPTIPVDIQRNINGGLYLETVNMNVLDASKLFLQKAREVLGQGSNLIFDFFDPTFFVLQNGIRSIHHPLVETLELRTAQSTSRVTNVKVVAMTLTIVSIVLMFLVILVVIKPIVWTIDDNRQSILVLFTEFPHNFLITFKVKCEMRLNRLSRARDQFLNAGFLIDDGVEETNINEAIDEQVNQPLINSDGKSQTTKDSKEKSSAKVTYKEDLFGNRHITLLKISSILALTILYFCITYYVEYLSLETNLKSIPNNIAYSSIRSVDRYASLYHLRKYLLQNFTAANLNGSPNSEIITFDFVNEEIDHLEEVQSYLAYGNSELNILAPSTSAQIFAYFGETCDPYDSYIPYDGCATFHQQIMYHGFHVAMIQGFDIMRKVLQKSLSLNLTSLADMNATINSDDLTTLRKLNEDYMPPLDSFSTTQYSSDLDLAIDRAYSIRLILLIIFLFGSYSMYLIYYNPLLWVLNNEQKRTITLLFMIPAAVMEQMTAVRLFVEQLASQTNTD